MHEVPLASKGGLWRRLFPSNIAAAAAAFVSGGIVPKVVDNSPDQNRFTTHATLALAAIDVAERGVAPGASVPNAAQFILFGTTTSNQTLSARVWGIAKGQGPVITTNLQVWQPMLLCEIAATLGAAEGAAGALIGASNLYADTYAITQGATSDIAIVNGTDIRGPNFRVDIQGFDQLIVELDDGGSAVTVNGLYRFLW